MRKTTKRTHTYPCVNLKTVTKGVIKLKQQLAGSLVMDVDNEHFLFRQRGTHTSRPELHWRLLDRSKHGRVSLNGRHVKVEFYIHHDEYASARQLADLLASEMETLGDNLCDIDLKEEAHACLC